MKKAKNLLTLVFAALLVLGMASCTGNSDIRKKDTKKVQYITFVFTNKTYEEVEDYLPEMESLYGKNDPNSSRMYAFGMVGPMMLTQSVEQMQEEINAGFDYAEKYNIPVYFQLDDVNNYSTYFGSDAKVKFYQDPQMCEWVKFPTSGEKWGGQKEYGALPQYWFNWGTWRKAEAFPNLASKSFQKFVVDNMKQGVLKPLVKRYRQLIDEGKSYLFAGIAVGWETHIPDYSPQNSLLASSLDPSNLPADPISGEKMKQWELTQYGYGALTSLGYTQAKLETEAKKKGVDVGKYTRKILDQVIHDYSQLLSETAYDAGLPRNKIFTHMVGATSFYTDMDTTFAPPIWCAVNPYSTPGFTMSPVTCKYVTSVLKSDIKKADPNMSNFSCAEGYAAGVNDEDSAIAYLKDLFGNGALMVTAFGYADPPTQYFTFQRTPDFGYNKAVNKWLKNQF